MREQLECMEVCLGMDEELRVYRLGLKRGLVEVTL